MHDQGDRENSQGSVAAVVDGNVGAIVELKSETDFSAKADDFTSLVQDLAELVAVKGEGAVADKAKDLEDLKLTAKENIELGQVVRFEAPAGHVIDSYLHVQGGRGVNAVLVELDGGTAELAHDVAVHVGFTKPKYLTRDEVPADVVAAERSTLEALTRNEGKPEAAIPKIVDGRIGGFFRENCLVEQAYVKDEKQSIQQLVAPAKVVRYAQVTIG